MNAKQAYILSKSYTDVSVEGAGAIKGKNCEIQSIEPITDGNRVTFAWYDGSDVLRTDTMDVMDGDPGTVVDISESGTASSSETSYQQISIDGVNTAIDGTIYMEQTIITSTSEEVDATFTNNAINANSLVDVYTSQYGLRHSNIVTTSGSCVVTFPAQDTSADVLVRIYIR